MDAFLATLEQTNAAAFFRVSRWGYAGLNALHIAGIAVLVGGILPLDLRLLGCWPGIERRTLARVLVPTAATGLVLTVGTGALLFSIRASEYAGLTIVWIKLALICLGVSGAIVIHARYGLWLQRDGAANLAGYAVLSVTCWSGALLSGRLIAFVQ